MAPRSRRSTARLIGLAVSSQIPCAYCIYADTADARIFGATDEEIKEAIMFAAHDPRKAARS